MSTVVESRLWSDILHAVEKKINRQSFDTWFRPLEFDGCDDLSQVLHLRAPNQVVKDWVSANYSEVINASLKELNLSTYNVDWKIEERDEESAAALTLGAQKAGDNGTFSFHENGNGSS